RAEQLDELGLLRDEALAAQRFEAHLVALRELAVEQRQGHRLVLDAEVVHEAALRHATMDRVLTAFEAGTRGLPTRHLALHAAARGLALARAHPATDELNLVTRAPWRLERMQCGSHGSTPPLPRSRGAAPCGSSRGC